MREHLKLKKQFEKLGVTAQKRHNKEEWSLYNEGDRCTFYLTPHVHEFGIRSLRLSFSGSEALIEPHLNTMISFYEEHCRKQSINIFEVSSRYQGFSDKTYSSSLPSYLRDLGFMPWQELKYQGNLLENTVNAYLSSDIRLKITCWDTIADVMDKRIAYERAFIDFKERDKTNVARHCYYANVWVGTDFYCLGVKGQMRLIYERDGQMYIQDHHQKRYAVSSPSEVYETMQGILNKLEKSLRIKTIFQQPRHHFYRFLDLYIGKDKKLQIDDYFLRKFTERKLEELAVDLQTKPKMFEFKTKSGKVKRVAFLNHIVIVGIKRVRIFVKEDAELANSAFEEELLDALRPEIQEQESVI